MENVLIEIGANSKKFLDEMDTVNAKTEDTEKLLKKAGVAAGVAFAGFTTAIMGSVYAYREQEKTALETEAILKATGGVAGVTAAAMNEYADSLSRVTTFSADQINASEQVLLGFTRIGKEVFERTTKATLDLAQKMGGDATGAAKLLGRALQDPEEGLKKLSKEGIFFTDQQKAQISAMQAAGDMAGAQAVILKQVEGQYGGMAQAAAGGTGAVIQLKNVLEDLAQDLGAQFAPFVSAAAVKLRDLVLAIKENEVIFKVAAGFIAAGAAVSGSVAALALGAQAYVMITKAIEMARIATTVFAGATRLAVGATGIGLLAIVAYEIYANWERIWPAVTSTFRSFAGTVMGISGGLAKTLRGVFTMDPEAIKAGILEASQAVTEAHRKVSDSVLGLFRATPEARAVAAETGRELGTTQAKERQLALQRGQDEQKGAEARARAASNQAELLQMRGHTAALVAIKRQEAEILGKLANAEYQGDRAALRRHLAQVQADYRQAYANEARQLQAFGQLKRNTKVRLSQAERTQLVASIKTEQDIKKEAEIKDLSDAIAADNTYLAEKEKFGATYAGINRFMHSEVIKDSSKAAGEMAGMVQSQNAVLKGMGKAAALYNIGVKTIESAQNIYAGWSTVPFVGHALGIAGAIAAVGFGVENSAKVMAMNKGGMVTGGVQGRDSVPLLAKPGELVTPPESYEEHINSVVASRMGKRHGGESQGQGALREVRVVVEMKGDAARILRVREIRDQALGTRRS